MKRYDAMSIQELLELKKSIEDSYESYVAKGLKLDMSRGKPETRQIDLSMELLNNLKGIEDVFANDGTDCRNYGILDGIPEARELFGEILGVAPEQVIVCGNSSLSLMYDTISRAMSHGTSGTPWSKLDKVRFLCPVPGYDRHFSITEFFGIEMINIKMNADGPDMDTIEGLIGGDESIKGIWCVPMYSNPQGITYSDEVVRRFANLKPSAADFRIIWDCAYILHHLDYDDRDNLLNIIHECEKAGSPDMPLVFASTSKITFAGGGISAIASSKNNIGAIKRQLAVQTIGYDKLNQLRHVKYLKNLDNIKEHMKKHADLLKPKFESVLDDLEKELGSTGIASWTNPKGGYFISLEVPDGCAKRVVELCENAGVILTAAGSAFPYGKDPKDSNIRIAPTVPTVKELETASSLMCLCVKLAAVEKFLQQRRGN